jgi:biotin carboxyl carrier protein
VAKHRFLIEGTEYEVEVGTRVGGTVPVTVNGRAYEVELAGGSAPSPVLNAPVAPRPVAVAPPPPPAPTLVAGGTGEVRAPIPGVVLSLAVSAGEKVAASSKLLVLEAMKMENEIFAGVAGVVAAVHVKPQQEVRQGDLLVTISPA